MSGPPAGPFKIVVLGEGRVGKTSLLRRYVRGTFDAGEASTQHAAYVEKQITVAGRPVKLNLWDTAGQERFHSLAPIYYRDADGALLVYDITDPDSFERASKWVNELRAMGRTCPVSIVGNKCDMQTQARVPMAKAEAYARQVGGGHSWASAKSGTGVEEAFLGLVQSVLQSSSSRGPQRGGLVVEDDRMQITRSRKRDKCCGGQ
mmetsp:Transcript_10164/g.22493  ORF Transcript_10164/g.22493 Transcript_10164/m.22493 type:complete len:205 (+) Transcript_10164:194-808(+)